MSGIKIISQVIKKNVRAKRNVKSNFGKDARFMDLKSVDETLYIFSETSGHRHESNFAFLWELSSRYNMNKNIASIMAIPFLMLASGI